MQEWNEQKLPKVLLGYSGGRLPGRSIKEKGREEGDLDEDSEEGQIRNEIAQEVVAGIKERQARMMMPRQLHKEHCSQIENEEEEEEDDWRKEN